VKSVKRSSKNQEERIQQRVRSGSTRCQIKRKKKRWEGGRGKRKGEGEKKKEGRKEKRRKKKGREKERKVHRRSAEGGGLGGRLTQSEKREASSLYKKKILGRAEDPGDQPDEKRKRGGLREGKK